MSSSATRVEVLRLQEDNDYLELKIKYIQSVATIFRQKISLIVREVLQQRSDGPQLATALDSFLDEIEVAEDTTSKTKAELEKPSLAVDGADYWRDQFLALMKDTKPTSLNDAQALCDLLQEKNQAAVREANLQRELRGLEDRHNALKVNHHDLLTNKAITADDAVKELYRLRVQELETNLTPEVLDDQRAAFAQLEEQNQHLHAQNKLLRHKNSELKKKMEEIETADNGVEAFQLRIECLTAEVQELKAASLAKDAELRRHKADQLHLQKNIELHELSLIRANGKLAALEAEAGFALQDGMADTDAKEVTMLRHKVDAFELHIRRLEQDNMSLSSKNTSLEQLTEEQQGALVSLKAEVEGLRSVCAIQRKTIQERVLCTEQRDLHTKTQSEIESRIGAAVEHLGETHCLREVALQYGRLHNDVGSMESRQKTIQKLEEKVMEAQTAIEAYKEELNRCVQFNATPNLEHLESVLVSSTKKPLAREVVLRRDGHWTEVRDAVSGNIRYVSTEAKGTPFAPSKPIPAPKKSSGTPSSSKPVSAASTPKPAPVKPTLDSDSDSPPPSPSPKKETGESSPSPSASSSPSHQPKESTPTPTPTPTSGQQQHQQQDASEDDMSPPGGIGQRVMDLDTL